MWFLCWCYFYSSDEGSLKNLEVGSFTLAKDFSEIIWWSVSSVIGVMGVWFSPESLSDMEPSYDDVSSSYLESGLAGLVVKYSVIFCAQFEVNNTFIIKYKLIIIDYRHHLYY
jgi:hypothetical protein